MVKMSEKKPFLAVLGIISMNIIVTLPALSHHQQFISLSIHTYDKKQKHTVITGLLAVLSMARNTRGSRYIGQRDEH